MTPCRLLNALLKCSLATTDSFGMDCRQRLVAPTAASQFPGVPKPSFRGAIYVESLWETAAFAHFDVMRGSVLPTAVSQMPPDALLRAMSRPPNGIRTDSGG
jgi:hypothetical protein